MAMKAELRPISEIPETVEFWSGTKVRLMNVGLNVDKPEDDFYDCLLTSLGIVPNHFILVNITTAAGRHKAGYCHLSWVEQKANVNRMVTTAAAIQRALEGEEVYLIVED